MTTDELVCLLKARKDAILSDPYLFAFSVDEARTDAYLLGLAVECLVELENGLGDEYVARLLEKRHIADDVSE